MPRWFTLALCGFGLTLLAAGVRQSARGRETRGWTRTQGRILEARVERLEMDDRQDLRFGFTIRYGYEARGRPYESEQVWIGSSAASISGDEAWPRRWVERFPAGSEAPVWFDPANPRHAVLVQGIPGAQVRVLLAVGALLLAIGVFALARSAGR